MLIWRQSGAAAAASVVDRRALTVERHSIEIRPTLFVLIGLYARCRNVRKNQGPIRPLWVFTALTSVKPATFSIGYKHEAKEKLGDIS